jgi:hypothetical protein
MFGRVKKFFGLGGVKIKLMPLEVYPKKVDTINGELEISSKDYNTVSYIRIKLIERYERGRGENKKIDEYELGEWVHNEEIKMDQDETKVIFFKLPFEFQMSNIEKMGSRGFLGRGLANLAKSMKGAKSIYRLEAEAVVEGSKTNPYDKAKIQFTP